MSTIKKGDLVWIRDWFVGNHYVQIKVSRVFEDGRVRGKSRSGTTVFSSFVERIVQDLDKEIASVREREVRRLEQKVKDAELFVEAAERRLKEEQTAYAVALKNVQEARNRDYTKLCEPYEEEKFPRPGDIGLDEAKKAIAVWKFQCDEGGCK